MSGELLYCIARKSIRSGETKIIEALEETKYDDAIDEFSRQVRKWLANDVSGTVLYREEPKPGWYDDSDNPILLDGCTITRYDDGHNEYFIKEIIRGINA